MQHLKRTFHLLFWELEWCLQPLKLVHSTQEQGQSYQSNVMSP